MYLDIEGIYLALRIDSDIDRGNCLLSKAKCRVSIAMGFFYIATNLKMKFSSASPKRPKDALTKPKANR